jgi:ribosome-binding protein aMBF1 (putative translation factor)
MKSNKTNSHQFIQEIIQSQDFIEYDKLEGIRLDVKTRIKQIRRAKNLTQEQLAEKMGVKQSYIAGLETGKRHPTLETLNKFCVAIGGRLEIIY